MIVDRQPCPVCEARPKPEPELSASLAPMPPLSHRPQAKSLDLSTPDKEDIIHTLWFSCARCGARWAATNLRAERIDE